MTTFNKLARVQSTLWLRWMGKKKHHELRFTIYSLLVSIVVCSVFHFIVPWPITMCNSFLLYESICIVEIFHSTWWMTVSTRTKWFDESETRILQPNYVWTPVLIKIPNKFSILIIESLIIKSFARDNISSL